MNAEVRAGKERYSFFIFRLPCLMVYSFVAFMYYSNVNFRREGTTACQH